MDPHQRLEDLPINACSKQWNSLESVGKGDRVRYCGDCELQVHNLASYPRAEAEALVSGAEGRLCVLKELLPDGTLKSEPKPVPLVRRVLAGATRAATWTLVLFGGLAASCKKTPTPGESTEEATTTAGEQTRELGSVGISNVELESLRSLGYVGH